MEALTVIHDLVNKTIETPGVMFGGSYRPMPIHWKSPMGDVVVLKIKGHSMWGGIGQAPNYVSARFLVLRLERKDGGRMRAEQLAWFPIKASGSY